MQQQWAREEFICKAGPAPTYLLHLPLSLLALWRSNIFVWWCRRAGGVFKLSLQPPCQLSSWPPTNLRLTPAHTRTVFVLVRSNYYLTQGRTDRQYFWSNCNLFRPSLRYVHLLPHFVLQYFFKSYKQNDRYYMS